MIWVTRLVNATMSVVFSQRQKTFSRWTCRRLGRSRAAAVVIVVDENHPGFAGRQGGVAAAAGLDGGLLIGGDHVVVAAQRFFVSHAGVQVEYELGFGGEVGIGDENTRLILPRFERMLRQPRADVAGEINSQIQSAMICWASSGHDQRDNGSAQSLGGVQAIALTRAT